MTIVLCLLAPTLCAIAAEPPSTPEAASEPLPGTMYINGLLQARQGDEQVIGIFAVDPNTGECRQVVENGHSMRVSPDGKHLCFGRFEPNNGRSTWVMPLDGSQPPRKVFDRAAGALWEPGGGDLLIGQDDDGQWPWVYKHWLVSIEIEALPPVEVNLSEDEIDDWSNDGEWLVTCSNRHHGEGIGYQLYLKRVDGTDERRLTEGPGLNVYARFNPTATSIVYLYSAEKQSALRRLDLAKGSKPVDLHRTNADGTAAPNEACWSPGGRWIAAILFDWHVEEDGTWSQSLSRDHKLRLVVMDREGGDRREIPLKSYTPLSIDGIDWR
jgi:Tol biopolymer transport system component